MSTSRCPICGEPLPAPKSTGRPRTWCSDRCGREARRRRQYGRAWGKGAWAGDPRRELAAQVERLTAALEAERARHQATRMRLVEVREALNADRAEVWRLGLRSPAEAPEGPVDGLSGIEGSTRPPAPQEPPEALSRAERRRISRFMRRG